MPRLDTHSLRVLMVKYAAFHGLAHEPGFDPSLHGSLGIPGRRFLLRIQKHMVADGKFKKVVATGILDEPTREALLPDRPSWQEEFRRIARQDDELDGEEYYTMGAKRWQGVQAVYGNVTAHPKAWAKLRTGDCSAGYTRWVLAGLQSHLGRVPHDVVNGASWQAGYTGTIELVCHRVETPQIADAILYGSHGNTTHVTGVYDVSARTCISHGRDKAEIYAWDAHPNRLGFYRPDVSKA